MSWKSPPTFASAEYHVLGTTVIGYCLPQKIIHININSNRNIIIHNSLYIKLCFIYNSPKYHNLKVHNGSQVYFTDYLLKTNEKCISHCK